MTQAYNFTSSDLGTAKFYFANGTTNGTTTAVAPAGYTLPTANGYPNLKTSVYDTAYGVSNTGSGQNVYGSSRPAQVSTGIHLFDPTALAGINTNPSFPSGHTTYAFTSSYLLAMLVPQEYQSSMARAAQYANSRIVLGVHYPLDIIASRSFSAEQLAQAFTNPAYVNNKTTTGTAINLPSLFTAASTELNGYLSAQCGATVATCAASSANANSLSPSAANAAAYAYDLTYGLPTLSYTQAPREQAPSGGPDASILLATLYGGSTAAAQTIAPKGGLDGSLATGTINQIVVNTEGQALAAFYGTSLSYWSRINLYAAGDYFSDAIGVLNMASTDVVNEAVTVASTGVLVDNGKINGVTTVQSGGVLGGIGSIVGNVAVQSGGTLAAGGFSSAGVQNAAGTLAITGALNLASGSTYGVIVTPTAASKTTVTGAATLGGAVAASFTSGSTFKSQYTILTAGSVSGAFSGVSNVGLPSGLADSLSYDAKDAYLDLAIGPIVAGGYNRNQQGVVNGLNAALSQAGSLSTTYASLTGASLSHADGEIGATSNVIVSQAGVGFLKSFFNGGLADPSSPEHTGADIAMFYAGLPTHKAPAVEAIPTPFSPYWTVWSTTSGGYQSLNGSSSDGSNTTTGTNWSEVVGAEYRASPDTSVGFGFGGGASDYSVTNGGGSGSYNYGELAIFGTHTFGSIYVTGAVAGGFGDVKNTRSDPTGASLEGDYTGSNVAGRLELGDAFKVAPGAVLTPYAAVQVSNAENPIYTETGGTGAYDLGYNGGDYTDTTSEIGVRAKQDFVQSGAVYTIGGLLAWSHSFNPTSSANVNFAALPGSGFTVYGVGPASNSALIQVGGKVALSNGWAFEARFDGQFGSGEQFYGSRGTVSYSW